MSVVSKPSVADDTRVDRVMVSTDTQAEILVNPDKASLKRVAWCYGCARKGSDVERELLRILLTKVRALP